MRLPAALLALSFAATAAAQSITVTIPATSFPKNTSSITGHLMVVFATHSNEDDEPRDQVQEQYTSAQAFGVDVNDLKPGSTVTICPRCRPGTILCNRSSTFTNRSTWPMARP
jgi:hypothetical protein